MTARIALRVARRSLRQHLGQSVLVSALVAVPVATATVVDGIARTGDHLTRTVTWPIILIIALGLTGLVCTAGMAFPARVRELAVIAVNGGTAKDLRRIVLAQGLVLGVLGTATGLVTGAVVTVLGAPLWQKLTGQTLTDLHFGWGELTVVAVVGILAGVVAPRIHPVDTPTGRVASTAVCRLADVLPPAGRMAIRYAARHRHRTVAAGAAVMVTVAGSIMVTAPAYLLLTGPAALITLLGVGVTVAWSVTDGDLVTLYALGARPRLRRRIAGAHAMVVTVLGTAAGLVIGVCAGIAGAELAPWQHALAISVAVPLLVPAVAAFAVPARPMVVRS